MSDLIKLLPDSVANQIAAGEVIQRPASVIKELIENAVDAGATKIDVIIEQAGKTLIQVQDNGKGMSPADARMSFERHATSKISKADDLFSIRTKGFRGEALASIAAIAQVELKTKGVNDETGTYIRIEGSQVKIQEACVCQPGTQFKVRNIFYNVPARRNFLKSDTVENKHLEDEFIRVSLAHPDISFTLTIDTKEIYRLDKGPLRQRIMGIYGKGYNEKIVPVDENAGEINLSGFIVKPEFSRKTRGEQFFFVNNRFIRNSYLHHAVSSAFDTLLPPDTHPAYFIFFEIPPAWIDINIHPTKTEIKFEDEKMVYAILRSAVKKSLGQYNITPPIDFDLEATVNIPFNQHKPVSPPSVRVNTDYNPFAPVKSKTDFRQYNNESLWNAPQKGSEMEFYKESQPQTPVQISAPTAETSLFKQDDEFKFDCVQFKKSFIICSWPTAVVIIDQHRAHHRILYEEYISRLALSNGLSQQLLFPLTTEVSPSDMNLLLSLQADLNHIGFQIRQLSKTEIALDGVPPELKESDIKSTFDKILSDLRETNDIHSEGGKQLLANFLSGNISIQTGQVLSREEMMYIARQLFECEKPYHSPSGKPTLINLPFEEITARLNK